MDLSRLAEHPNAVWAFVAFVLAWRPVVVPAITTAVAIMWHDWLDYRFKVKQLEASSGDSGDTA